MKLLAFSLVATDISYLQEFAGMDALFSESVGQTVLWGALIIVVLLLLLGLVVHYYRMALRFRDAMEQRHSKVKGYSSRIAELEESVRRRTKEIEVLNKKIDKLRQRQAVMLGRGKALCDEISNGGDTAKWNRADFEAAVEHLRTVNPVAVDKIESDYSGLTAQNIFFLCLPLLGITEGDMPFVMNMSKAAARTLRYRLRKKKISM